MAGAAAGGPAAVRAAGRGHRAGRGAAACRAGARPARGQAGGAGPPPRPVGPGPGWRPDPAPFRPGDRRDVVTWLNRGTLHLVRTEDYWWLHPLPTPPLFTGNARRLAQEGVPPDDAERGVAVIERSLTAEGPLTRAQLAERIAKTGVRTQGQAIVHLLGLASLRGIPVRGPMAGREQAYALVRDWLGEPPWSRGAAAFDRDRALADLAARYLAGHGPATERDLAKWAGLPLGDARRGLAAIAGRLADRDD